MEENQKLARIYGPRSGQGFLVVLYPRKANEPEPKSNHSPTASS